jgi:hypothetical protein
LHAQDRHGMRDRSLPVRHRMCRRQSVRGRNSHVSCRPASRRRCLRCGVLPAGRALPSVGPRLLSGEHCALRHWTLRTRLDLRCRRCVSADQGYIAPSVTWRGDHRTRDRTIAKRELPRRHIPVCLARLLLPQPLRLRRRGHCRTHEHHRCTRRMQNPHPYDALRVGESGEASESRDACRFSAALRKLTQAGICCARQSRGLRQSASLPTVAVGTPTLTP